MPVRRQKQLMPAMNSYRGSMATFVVCSQCGKVHETTGPDQLPKGWSADLRCPICSDEAEDEPAINVFEEQVIYPRRDIEASFEDTIDDFCDVCDGFCQGH